MINKRLHSFIDVMLDTFNERAEYAERVRKVSIDYMATVWAEQYSAPGAERDFLETIRLNGGLYRVPVDGAPTILTGSFLAELLTTTQHHVAASQAEEIHKGE